MSNVSREDLKRFQNEAEQTSIDFHNKHGLDKGSNIGTILRESVAELYETLLTEGDVNEQIFAKMVESLTDSALRSSLYFAKLPKK